MEKWTIYSRNRFSECLFFWKSGRESILRWTGLNRGWCDGPDSRVNATVYVSPSQRFFSSSFFIVLFSLILDKLWCSSQFKLLLIETRWSGRGNLAHSKLLEPLLKSPGQFRYHNRFASWHAGVDLAIITSPNLHSLSRSFSFWNNLDKGRRLYLKVIHLHIWFNK